MAWIFRSNKRVNDQPKAAAGLRIQSSVQGRPIALLLGGQARVSGNLIWYGDFRATAVQQSGGGKGSVGGGGGGKGSSGQQGYTYRASVAVGLSEGPIAEVVGVWNNKTSQTLAELDLTEFLGTYAQTAWSYLTTNHPTEAIPYRGISYVAAGPFQLGDSAELPNMTFELRATNSNTIAGLPDGDLSVAATDLLTNTYYGIGFPSSRWADQTDWSNYSVALGIVGSPLLADQSDCASVLREWVEWTNCDLRWSVGKLKVIPRATAEVTGNGRTYTPDTTPVYDFTVDQFIANQGGMGRGSGSVPLAVTRRPQAEMPNNIKVEYLDRENDYNPVAIERKDEAAIIAFGRERAADQKALHWLCDADAADAAAILMLIRERIPRLYQWTAGRRYILLDPTDLVTVTDPSRNIVRQGVRITEIKENGDGTLTFTGEEWPGVPSPPLYGREATAGYVPNLNTDPGLLNDPLIFEPTQALANGLEIWAAISGADVDVWGGADVYASYDGDTYALVGRVLGPARMGVLTAALPVYTPEPTGGQTIDQTNTLAVDLSQSEGELTSGTVLDAASLNTAMYVDGEVVAYQTATLTGPNAYNLTYLVRGAYDTTTEMETEHAIGSKICRLDQGIIHIPYDQTRVGAVISIKMCSYNIWGGGKQSLADVGTYTYTILGTALASPLDPITNLRTVFIDGVTNLSWDEVTDFRTVRYEIRLGDTSEESALTLGTVAHPPFVIPGNGTYWVSAVAEPLPDLIVYSSAWSSVTVTGAALVTNVVVTWDEKTTGWTGTFTGGAGVDGTAIRTGGGDVLSIADFLAEPDILNYGIQQNGSYTIPAGHIADVGYVAPCLITVFYLPLGQQVGSDILTLSDFLGQHDILGAEATRFVRVRPQIQIAQELVTDLYEATDLYAVTDLYEGVSVWSDWQDFTPGVYLGRLFNFRLLLETVDPNTICYDLEFTFTVDVPDRIDSNGIVGGVLTSLTNLLLDAAGTTITFASNTQTAAVGEAFNGGPGGSSVPNIQVTIRGATAGDDVMVTAVSLSGCTVRVMNAGAGAARNVDIRPQGY